MSFQEGKAFIDNHLAQVAQQLGTRVIQQGDQRLYTSRIRATAHRPKRRSTRLHHRTTRTPIPETGMLATSGELSLDSPSHTAFLQAWEREWDRDSHSVLSDSEGQGLGAAMQTGQIPIPVEDHL